MTLAPADPDHLTQRELEQALWAAANALRGPVDPGDFKAYVFPVLFYKWISDVYDFRHEQAIADLGDDWTQQLILEWWKSRADSSAMGECVVLKGLGRTLLYLYIQHYASKRPTRHPAIEDKPALRWTPRKTTEMHHDHRA